MWRKFYIITSLLTITTLTGLTNSAQAQYLQLNYDFGEQSDGVARDYFTTYLEFFKPDAYGSTFWFVDMAYDNPGNRSLSVAYWEIARYFRMPNWPTQWSLTLQYNDGMAPWGSLGQVWLAGLNYPISVGGRVLSTDLLYRHMHGSTAPDFQFTVAWYENFLADKLTLSGYLDIWTQDDATGNAKHTVVLARPQFWYNLNPVWGVGGGFELSNNFLPTSDWEFMPQVGVKWTF
ncbi:MAG: DUF5020 family protein [Lentisphaeria bacterium]|nr:DUF5020 family protein [Candidatus Neomarinimicrobiota bacterium]MCF7843036.1 DUF5020 family protein [Lentisphaeria bacterium]